MLTLYCSHIVVANNITGDHCKSCMEYVIDNVSVKITGYMAFETLLELHFTTK
jgi:hypothetical protein